MNITSINTAGFYYVGLVYLPIDIYLKIIKRQSKMQQQVTKKKETILKNQR